MKIKTLRMASNRLAKSEVLLVIALAIIGLPFARSQEVNETVHWPDITIHETPGELWVSRNSSYCDWEHSMGPRCVYNETNQVVVVPAGLTLPSGKLEVEIHMAKTVHVYPTCISWIQIFNAGLVTTLPSEQDFYTIYHKRCRTWLRVYNSNADVISHGVKDLTIINTLVNTINLVQQRDFMAINSTVRAIEALSWEGYRGTIQNTTIQKITNVVAKDNWLVIDSHFGLVAPDGIVFKAKEMSVANSSISHISTNGMNIMNGALTLSNVTIGLMEASAIWIKTPAAFLYMNNVTIDSAFPNCIVVPDKDKIQIENVKIKGIPLDLTSPYIQYLDEIAVPVSQSKIQVNVDSDECTSSNTTLVCDYQNINETIEVSAESIDSYKHVTLKNINSLQVLSTPCDSELELVAVNGTLPHFLIPDNETSQSGSTGPCAAMLSVHGAALDVINGHYISTLNITNSTVKRIHDGSLESMNFKNVSLNIIDSVNVTGQDQNVWDGVVLSNIYNFTLNSPLKAKSIHITQRLRNGAIIIDHPNATTELTDVRLSTLEKGSFLVKSGKLLLRDSLAIALNEGAIYVEEGASIELNRVVSFLTSFRTISVATRDQVTLNGTTDVRLEMMLHIRNPPPIPDMGSNFTISAVHLSSYCTSVPFFLKMCDFSHLDNASVVIDLDGDQQSHRAVIKGASFVTIYPSCVEKLILLRVIGATTVDNEKDCDTWLEAKGVHFQNITAGVHDVTLTSCSVDLLSPNRKLRDLDLENTNVKWIAGVQWSGYTGLFNNSVIGKIEGLVASSRMVMTNTTVEKILKQGVQVMDEGVINNSTITEIFTKGITVRGMLQMKDVIIDKLAREAIVVEDGLLHLSNVTINSAEELSIIAKANGGVAMQNVTVGGKRVQWVGYLANELTPYNHSLIFVNKHADEKSNVPNTPATSADEATQPSPKASSMTKPEDSGNVPGTVGGLSADESIQEEAARASSWKWASAGIGLFSIILLGACIVFTIKLVRPNSGRLMPIVFWRIKDDQNDLLADDQSTSGYQVVPASEVC